MQLFIYYIHMCIYKCIYTHIYPYLLYIYFSFYNSGMLFQLNWGCSVLIQSKYITKRGKIIAIIYYSEFHAHALIRYIYIHFFAWCLYKYIFIESVKVFPSLRISSYPLSLTLTFYDTFYFLPFLRYLSKAWRTSLLTISDYELHLKLPSHVNIVCRWMTFYGYDTFSSIFLLLTQSRFLATLVKWNDIHKLRP